MSSGSSGSHAPNVGPGGCVSWDDFAIWLRRVNVHVQAAQAASLIEDVPANALRPLWSVLDALESDVAGAMVVNEIREEAPRAAY